MLRIKLIFERLRTIIANNKTLLMNFSYLSIIKVVTMFLPLFTYPYLLNTIGQEKYGLLIYAQAIIGYFVIFINFGFSITTTREVSIHRDNIVALSKIVSSTYLIKIILFICSFLILCVLRLFVHDIAIYFDLFVYTLLWLALFEVLFPIYYFQGTEKMKYITLVTLTSRLLFFLFIFIFITKEDDYILFPILNFVGSIIGLAFSFYILHKDGIRFVKPTKEEIFYHVKSSYIMGLAVGSNSLKTNLNIILIKSVLSLKEVAVFDLISKIVFIGNTVIDLISQTVFPKIAKDKNKLFFKKVIKLVLVFAFGVILCNILLGKFAIGLLSADKMLDSYPLLILMSLIIPIYSLGTMLGRNCLNVYGQDKHVLYSMTISSLLYVLIFLFCKNILDLQFDIYLFTVIYLVSFLIDTVYRFVVCKRLNLI